MPYVMRCLYEPDALDRKMRAEGWLSAPEAADALRSTERSLEALAVQCVLTTEKVHGRTYYAEVDIADLAAGRSPTDRHRHEQEQWNAVAGYSESASQAPRSDPGMDFLRLFGS
jgi:hypothetical protein